MTNAVLIDIDPLLMDRIKRIASARDWGMQTAMVHLIEHGLFACEAELAARFDDTDAKALQAAIDALKDIPDDPGFAMIGRAIPPADKG